MASKSVVTMAAAMAEKKDVWLAELMGVQLVALMAVLWVDRMDDWWDAKSAAQKAVMLAVSKVA